MTPSVSVIIPVWNAEAYLRRCLDSVCAQTLTNLEVICVNDASTDNSLNILHEYAARDARLRVVSLPVNAGESVARNTALALARGEYIGSVDNDDAIAPDFYEKLYTNAKASSADIVKGNVMEHNLHGRIYERNINPGVRANALMFRTQWWSALYSTRMLREHTLCFPEYLVRGGDTVFLTQALLCAQKIATVDDAFYHVYIRAESTSRFFTEERGASAVTSQKIIVQLMHDAFVWHKEDEVYRKIFFDIFMGVFHIGTYFQLPEKVQYMAETLCALYAACPFSDYVNENMPLAALRSLLQHNDVKGVAALALQLAPKEYLGARLRAQVRLQWQGRAGAGKPPHGTAPLINPVDQSFLAGKS